MPAASYNFTIDKGAAFYISFDYKDSSNTIINLTNWCARFSFLPEGSSTPVTYISDTINSVYSFTIQPSLGKIILKLPATTTDTFNFNFASYDLDLKSPNELYTGAGDQIIKLLKGTFTMITSNVVNPEPFSCNIITDPDQCIDCG
jgi:hypothetical protein